MKKIVVSVGTVGLNGKRVKKFISLSIYLVIASILFLILDLNFGQDMQSVFAIVIVSIFYYLFSLFENTYFHKENDMVNKIQNFYNEYKVFINRREMPKIVPNFDMSDSILDSLAYIDRDDIRGENIPIYINTNLFKYPKQYYKSILFHEFTEASILSLVFLYIFKVPSDICIKQQVLHYKIPIGLSLLSCN